MFRCYRYFLADRSPDTLGPNSPSHSLPHILPFSCNFYSYNLPGNSNCRVVHTKWDRTDPHRTPLYQCYTADTLTYSDRSVHYIPANSPCRGIQVYRNLPHSAPSLCHRRCPRLEHRESSMDYRKIHTQFPKALLYTLYMFRLIYHTFGNPLLCTAPYSEGCKILLHIRPHTRRFPDRIFLPYSFHSQYHIQLHKNRQCTSYKSDHISCKYHLGN